jgi:hypothetical protein
MGRKARADRGGGALCRVDEQSAQASSRRVCRRVRARGMHAEVVLSAAHSDGQVEGRVRAGSWLVMGTRVTGAGSRRARARGRVPCVLAPQINGSCADRAMVRRRTTAAAPCGFEVGAEVRKFLLTLCPCVSSKQPWHSAARRALGTCTGVPKHNETQSSLRTQGNSISWAPSMSS